MPPRCSSTCPRATCRRWVRRMAGAHQRVARPGRGSAQPPQRGRRPADLARRRHRGLHPQGADQRAGREQGRRPDRSHPARSLQQGAGVAEVDGEPRHRRDDQPGAPADHRAGAGAPGAGPGRRSDRLPAAARAFRRGDAHRHARWRAAARAERAGRNHGAPVLRQLQQAEVGQRGRPQGRGGDPQRDGEQPRGRGDERPSAATMPPWADASKS